MTSRPYVAAITGVLLLQIAPSLDFSTVISDFPSINFDPVIHHLWSVCGLWSVICHLWSVGSRGKMVKFWNWVYPNANFLSFSENDITNLSTENNLKFKQNGGSGGGVRSDWEGVNSQIWQLIDSFLKREHDERSVTNDLWCVIKMTKEDPAKI